jgi:small subunit ribosomal protein S1
VAGIVRSIETYGIFVELTPNLAGLAEYRPDMAVGQVAAVYIKNIIPERMKLKLVLIDSYRGEGEPSRHVIGYPSETAHIDRWRYSPACCPRVIETVFE